jgi:hypothetical protein
MRIPSCTILLLSAYVVGGCVSTSQLAPSAGSSSWKSEGFSVQFFAGPKSFEDQKSTSRYEVIPTRLGSIGRLIVSSAHSTGGFESVTNPAPTNYIKVLPDSKSEALIIQETIPNDCGPCTNYIWIRPDGPTRFTHSYLQLPSRTTGPPGGIDYEFPEVVSLHNGQLTYRYTKGSAITVRAELVPGAKEPTPPG